MNTVIIIGRLVADPEIKTTTNGVSVASFNLAVNRNFKNAQGEREADFPRCIAFRKTAELIGQYLSKGSKVAVNGRIQTRSYDNQQGQKVYVTEVVVNEVEFLDSKQDNQQQNQQPTYQQPTQPSYQYQQPKYPPQDTQPVIDISEDDLPF